MSPSVGKSPGDTDYYTVLGLSAAAQLSPDTLRTAYRCALLLHHPDKAVVQQTVQGSPEISRHCFTVDQITEAYETLSDPVLKSSYDEGLRRTRARLVTNERSRNGAGLETFDLEDLEFDTSSQRWSRKCRCGGTYNVSEQELEEAASEAEVIACCHGCSLCIRVTFDTVCEDDAA